MAQRNYTIVEQRLPHFSPRNKPPKRLMTQFAQNQAAWFTTQKYIGGKKPKLSKLKLLSGQNQKAQSQDSLKKPKNFQDLLEWHNKFSRPGLKKNGQKKDENISDFQLLKSHIQSIPTKKTRRIHHRTQTQPNIYYVEYKKSRIKTAEVPMDRINYSKCCDLIDDIYQKIAILKEIGYSDDKIDGWVLAFCQGRKPFMKAIFMRNINYSVYSLKEEFQYEKDVKSVKDRIRFQIQKNKDVYNYVQVGQLSELSYYLQQILIQKNMKKAKEVQQSILEKLSLELMPKVKTDFCVFTKKQATEVYNFLDELTPFEAKFGDFVSFSKINKLRFLQLNKVQTNLKSIYKQMLQNQIKKVQRLKSRQKTIKI